MVFQSFINELFRDLLNQFVIAYIDEISIYSCIKTDHIQHVKTVLNRLQANQLYVKAEKCKKMDQAKVKVVTEWPRPTLVKKFEQFLGFANFY